MIEKECCNRINDLRAAKTIYERFLDDPTSAFFGSELVKSLLKETNFEIYRLSELIENGELEDSLGNKAC